MDNTIDPRVAAIVGKAAPAYSGDALRKRIVEDTMAKMQPSQGFFAETASDIGQTASGVVDSVSGTASDIGKVISSTAAGEQGVARGIGQGLGRLAGGVSDLIGQGVKGIAKVLLPGGAETAVKDTVKAVVSPIVQTPVVQDFIKKYDSMTPAEKRDVAGLMGVSSLALDAAGFGVGKKAATAAAPIAKEAAAAAAETAGKAARAAGAAAKAATAAPEPTFVGAVGQVLGKAGKGKTYAAQQAGKALSELDLSGVDTYAKLAERMGQRVDQLKGVVDSSLALDSVPKKLSTLTSSAKTANGEIKTNFVRLAIKQLQELYLKTGDLDGTAAIRDITERAGKVGLTAQEINNLARTYGTEFGQKAFGKTGEALTSVNAQLYENTRKGLKTLARGFVKGDAAQAADRAMSAVIGTRQLVQKNVEEVAKLLGVIQKRSALESLGHYVTKYADMLSGNFLRGAVGGLLPRGVGNKVMNAIDLERALGRNLKVIQEAMKTEDPAALEELLKTLAKPLGTSD